MTGMAGKRAAARARVETGQTPSDDAAAAAAAAKAAHAKALGRARSKRFAERQKQLLAVEGDDVDVPGEVIKARARDALRRAQMATLYKAKKELLGQQRVEIEAQREDAAKERAAAKQAKAVAATARAAAKQAKAAVTMEADAVDSVRTTTSRCASFFRARCARR